MSSSSDDEIENSYLTCPTRRRPYPEIYYDYYEDGANYIPKGSATKTEDDPDIIVISDDEFVTDDDEDCKLIAEYEFLSRREAKRPCDEEPKLIVSTNELEAELLDAVKDEDGFEEVELNRDGYHSSDFEFITEDEAVSAIPEINDDDDDKEKRGGNDRSMLDLAKENLDCFLKKLTPNAVPTEEEYVELFDLSRKPILPEGFDEDLSEGSKKNLNIAGEPEDVGNASYKLYHKEENRLLENEFLTETEQIRRLIHKMYPDLNKRAHKE